MNSIINEYFFKTVFGSYTYNNCLNDWPIQMLYNIFGEGDAEKFKRALNWDQEYANFNGPSYIRKLRKGRIALGDDYDILGREFELDKEHFFELVNKWKELTYKLKPTKIIISRNGDRFTIEAAD